MLKIDNTTEKIRQIIETTNINKVYSPDLPQDGDKICAITLLNGNTDNALNNTMLYAGLQFRALIRGNKNDKETRQLAEQVFNALHLQKNILIEGGKIINIIASIPTYAFRDENQRIHYNITFNANVE